MKVIYILSLLFLVGCSSISSYTTPKQIKELTAISYSLSKLSVSDRPTGENLELYLKYNRDAWEQMAIFYGLKNGQNN